MYYHINHNIVVNYKDEPQSQETDSLETRAELAVLRTYVENQAILEPILYGHQNVNKPNCLWTHNFTFL